MSFNLDVALFAIYSIVLVFAIAFLVYFVQKMDDYYKEAVKMKIILNAVYAIGDDATRKLIDDIDVRES